MLVALEINNVRGDAVLAYYCMLSRHNIFVAWYGSGRNRSFQNSLVEFTVDGVKFEYICP